jgi:hypothetical protein
VIVVDAIWDAFHLEAEVKTENNITYVRVHGLDSASLAKWIKSKFSKLKVDYKPHMSYQFSDDNWIKVECGF